MRKIICFFKPLYVHIALACPRLLKPEFGTILPTNCMYGDTFAGERCFLHCPSGYKAIGKRVAVCNSNLEWQPNSELQCIPVRSSNEQLAVQQQHHHHRLQNRVQQHSVRPTIKCPKDMTIVKPKNHETILVRLEKPETNVDWDLYVDSQPLWGKKLEATLSTGATEVTFRARSPHNNMFDMCRVIINVIGMSHVHCSFSVRTKQVLIIIIIITILQIQFHLLLHFVRNLSSFTLILLKRHVPFTGRNRHLRANNP